MPLVRKRGLEPLHLSAPEPKSGVSTNSTTPASVSILPVDRLSRVKPFLLLATRAQDEAADAEYEAFLACGRLAERDLHRVRLERDPMPRVVLSDYSGIILGGSPFNNSDPPHTKSDIQLRVEADVMGLLDEVIPLDFPFLGACYGVGSIGVHQGGVVDATYAEAVGAVGITLNDEGLADALFRGLPPTFRAFVGHKEAITKPPASAVALASSSACPVQAFRVGHNVYATQFHPELDAEGICLRIDVYRDHGYFEPGEAQSLKDAARVAGVTHPGTLMRQFVELYALN